MNMIQKFRSGELDGFSILVIDRISIEMAGIFKTGIDVKIVWYLNE